MPVIATTTLVFSAFLPLPATFAAQYCAAAEPVCARLAESPVAAAKVDAEALDRTSGDFLRTRWIAPGVMARTIWQDGVRTCSLLYRDAQGRLAETEDPDACL
jgi:hypothetical protein